MSPPRLIVGNDLRGLPLASSPPAFGRPTLDENPGYGRAKVAHYRSPREVCGFAPFKRAICRLRAGPGAVDEFRDERVTVHREARVEVRQGPRPEG
jgi:hypothetical protein